MKAAVYCHTGHGTDAALASQESRCRRLAMERGADEILTITDQGRVPRAAQRPGLARLLRLVHSGEVGLVVVDEATRLSWRIADGRDISREVSQAGASLVFVS